MTTRRELLIAIGAGAFVAPFDSFAQQQGKVWRIGILHPNSPVTGGHLLDMFRQGLHELGYIEGKNISFEYRFAEGSADRLPALAAELLQQKVDIIFASNSSAAEAAKQATKVVPVVFATVADPVQAGLAETLAHPGGNSTGTSIMSVELAAKRLQLLKEVFPKGRRVAVQTSEADHGPKTYAEIQRAAEALGIQILAINVQRRDEIESTLTMLRRSRVDFMYVTESATNARNRKLLAELALRARLGLMAGTRGFVEDGALMGYGPNYADNYYRAAIYVDRILKGARPGDLPIEQPTKFELTINMKTAKSLGIKIPNSILVRADKVIE